MSFVTHKSKIGLKSKKKPPPRPPPPNFAKYKSKSSFNLNQPLESLIEWSPPRSPTVDRTHTFGGSVSSSFSSSTSSLASSKKSFEYDVPVTNNLWPINTNGNYQNHPKPTLQQAVQYGKPNVSAPVPKQASIPKQSNVSKVNVPTIFGPTIIRAQVPKIKPSERKQNNSDPPSPVLPMPSVPPPSPPKEASDVDVPFGIALYDYQATDPRDLSFQVNDVVILLRRINSEWLYGKVLDKEGMFPANFIDIQVPLSEDANTVMALYEFNPQMAGDLALKPGQLVKVLRRINNDWLYGECNGQTGQFPSNFVDRIPNI
uniref:SH3 domain-containing protein n=1 Tax=Anoplophora glabripennis TaxID=217634 RepID=V5FY66_ANOGL